MVKSIPFSERYTYTFLSLVECSVQVRDISDDEDAEAVRSDGVPGRVPTPARVQRAVHVPVPFWVPLSHFSPSSSWRVPSPQ